MAMNIEKHFLIDEEGALELKRKAKMTGLSESNLIRQLIEGFEPKSAPTESFDTFYRRLRKVSSYLEAVSFRLYQKGNKTESENIDQLLVALHKAMTDYEWDCRVPGSVKSRWQ